MDIKENMQLPIKSMMATKLISSKRVCSDFPKNFKEVSTIKQMPNKLDEAFNMCGDLSGSCSMELILSLGVRLNILNYQTRKYAITGNCIGAQVLDFTTGNRCADLFKAHG